MFCTFNLPISKSVMFFNSFARAMRRVKERAFFYIRELVEVLYGKSFKFDRCFSDLFLKTKVVSEVLVIRFCVVQLDCNIKNDLLYVES